MDISYFNVNQDLWNFAPFLLTLTPGIKRGFMIVHKPFLEVFKSNGKWFQRFRTDTFFLIVIKNFDSDERLKKEVYFLETLVFLRQWFGAKWS